jgi:hypothetical protein
MLAGDASSDPTASSADNSAPNCGEEANIDAISGAAAAAAASQQDVVVAMTPAVHFETRG